MASLLCSRTSGRPRVLDSRNSNRRVEVDYQAGNAANFLPPAVDHDPIVPVSVEGDAGAEDMPGLLDRLLGRSKDAVPDWIDVDTLRQRQVAGEPVLLIDVRGDDEFGAPPGHLPGAVNIPLPELPGRVAEVAGQSRPVVLVCKTDRRSAKAAEILLAAGVPDVAVLRGGTDGWHQRGLPLD
jgi:rhodanese-related sulfurtransferase